MLNSKDRVPVHNRYPGAGDVKSYQKKRGEGKSQHNQKFFLVDNVFRFRLIRFTHWHSHVTNRWLPGHMTSPNFIHSTYFSATYQTILTCILAVFVMAHFCACAMRNYDAFWLENSNQSALKWLTAEMLCHERGYCDRASYHWNAHIFWAHFTKNKCRPICICIQNKYTHLCLSMHAV